MSLTIREKQSSVSNVMPFVIERREPGVRSQDYRQESHSANNQLPAHARVRPVGQHPKDNHRNAKTEGEVDKPPTVLP